MLAYWDIGLGVYAWLLLRQNTAVLAAIRKRATDLRYPLPRVFLGVLGAAALWPLIPLLYLLGVGRRRNG